MQYRQLGNSDLQVSEIALGSWLTYGVGVDARNSRDCLSTAFDCGINFIDTANIYGKGAAESFLGDALHGIARDSYVLATKLFFPMTDSDQGLSAAQVHKQLNDSLRRLRTDYIDLYQHHFPDSETPVEETLRALEELVQQGKVRAIGCSNYTGAMLAEAAGFSAGSDSAAFVSAQNRYSLLTRDIEAELVPVAEQHRVGILPYFPLESGLLTGKYRQGEKAPADTRFGKWGGGGIFASDERYEIVEGLRAYGDSIGRSVLDIAIGWLAAQPYVSSVIAGVTKPEQIRGNVAAASWSPTEQQCVEIADIARARA